MYFHFRSLFPTHFLGGAGGGRWRKGGGGGGGGVVVERVSTVLFSHVSAPLCAQPLTSGGWAFSALYKTKRIRETVMRFEFNSGRIGSTPHDFVGWRKLYCGFRTMGVDVRLISQIFLGFAFLGWRALEQIISQAIVVRWLTYLSWSEYLAIWSHWDQAQYLPLKWIQLVMRGVPQGEQHQRSGRLQLREVSWGFPRGQGMPYGMQCPLTDSHGGTAYQRVNCAM